MSILGALVRVRPEHLDETVASLAEHQARFEDAQQHNQTRVRAVAEQVRTAQPTVPVRLARMADQLAQAMAQLQEASNAVLEDPARLNQALDALCQTVAPD